MLQKGENMSTNFNTKTTTVRALLDIYNKILVPEWFQRNNVWTGPQQTAYLQSIFDNFATTPIVLADVLSCAEARPSKNYDVILEGFRVRFISMDGQNRTETLWRFYNNEITFTGTVVDRGETYEYKNCFFKDLDEAVRFAFLDASVVIQEYSNLAFEHLPTIFRRLNAGMPLNPQEVRNSEQTYIAKWVRLRSGVHGTYHGAMGSCFTPHSRARMTDSEHIVKFLVYARTLIDNPSQGQSKTVSKGALDDYYEKGIDTFELSQKTFSKKSMSAYGDELLWLDTAMSFHKKALRHFRPATTIKTDGDRSNLLLSMWLQARLRADERSMANYGLNEHNFLNKVVAADAELKKADKSGDGYRELARTNWQGAAVRCTELLKLLKNQMSEKEAA